MDHGVKYPKLNQPTLYRADFNKLTDDLMATIKGNKLLRVLE